MAVETDVLDELRRLRTRIPRLTGSLAATVDGLVLAHDVPDTEPEDSRRSPPPPSASPTA